MEKLEKLYEGKAKQLYATDDPEVLWVEYKNTATAGDGEKKEDFTGKGRLNNLITTIIFDLLKKRGIDSHLIKRVDDTGQLVRKVNMFPLEIVLRNVAAGHFCSRLGVEEGLPLKEPVLEYFLKNDDLHDPFVNDDDLVALGVCTREDLAEIAPLARKINEALIEIFAKIDVKLVDFKIEMGRATDGTLLLPTRSPRIPAVCGTRRTTPARSSTLTRTCSAVVSAASSRPTKRSRSASPNSPSPKASKSPSNALSGSPLEGSQLSLISRKDFHGFSRVRGKEARL